MTNTRSLTQIHILLAVQSIVVILVSINRLSSLTTGFVSANEFLRWVDLHNMLTLPLTSVVAFYLVKRWLEGGTAASPPARPWEPLALSLVFIIGVYLLAASYGDHEVTNYLHTRFCPEVAATPTSSDLCRIVIFNDDEFSHWIFFTGFVLINGSLMLLQNLFPHAGNLNRWDLIWLIVNGLFIALGIFANLAFEVIGLDLYVVALLAAAAFGLLWRRGRQPLFVYYATAYGLGLIATFIVKALG